MEMVFGRPSLRVLLYGGHHIKLRRVEREIYGAAEIGTYKGINAATIWRKLKPGRLVCVDPYKAYANKAQLECDTAKQAAHTRLCHANVEWVETTDRAKAARIIGKVDYLYIDGAHDYENVKADIAAYWSCVRKGGVMGGHDIHRPAVFKAVAEFALANNLDCRCDWLDWWIVK